MKYDVSYRTEDGWQYVPEWSSPDLLDAVLRAIEYADKNVSRFDCDWEWPVVRVYVNDQPLLDIQGSGAKEFMKHV